MHTLGIDPGLKESGYVILRDEPDFKIVEYGIVENAKLVHDVIRYPSPWDVCGIEMIESFGKAVGVSTFGTVLWIGEFRREIKNMGRTAYLLPRSQLKLNICHSRSAKNSFIRQALIDRFGAKGTKKDPGFCYGLSDHTWSALAVATTTHDYLYLTELGKNPIKLFTAT